MTDPFLSAIYAHVPFASQLVLTRKFTNGILHGFILSLNLFDLFIYHLPKPLHIHLAFLTDSITIICSFYNTNIRQFIPTLSWGTFHGGLHGMIANTKNTA